DLNRQGIISGVSDTEFEPARNITRAEFAAILMRAIGADTENAKCSFEDVPEDAWYYGAVAAAYEMGVVSGFSDTYFGASENITRQDMAAMLMRLTAKADITLVRKRNYAEFTDEDSISDYAKNSVHILYQCEIINGLGDGTFAPLDNTT
ncbi:MAG: S-layer homology domain-containing protein, partial [Clostridia bacterium]|nr:S-layer homology domain-containing protein [Clostridia bacterium]